MSRTCRGSASRIVCECTNKYPIPSYVSSKICAKFFPRVSKSLELSALFRVNVLNEEEAQRGFDWEIKFSKPALRILGLWPFNDTFVHVKFLLCLILIVMYSLPSIFRIVFIGSDDSVERPLQIITEIVALVYTIVQYSLFKGKINKVSVVLGRIYEDWDQSVNLSDEDKKPMLVYGGRTRSICGMCMLFLLLSCLGYFAEPLLTMLIKGNEKSLPNKGLYPFDTNTSPNYQIVYIMQAFIGVLCAISFTCIDGFFVLSVFHGCGQLAVLCKTIDNYEGQTRHINVSSDDEKKKFNIHCSCLKCIVDRHVSLSEYATVVNDIYNGIVMARLITSTIHFCGVGYIIIKLNERQKFADLLLNLVYMGTMTFHLFLYCWIGQQLLDEGENIGRAFCKLHWHKEKPKVARSLLLPILRSRRPLKITAGRYFIMSLMCFKEWFLNSVGYLSVLLAIKNHS